MGSWWKAFASLSSQLAGVHFRYYFMDAPFLLGWQANASRGNDMPWRLIT